MFDLIIIAYSQADPGPPVPWGVHEQDPDPAAPVLLHFAPTPPEVRRRGRRSGTLPPLLPWQGPRPRQLSDAEALRAIAWIIQGYTRSEIARCLGVKRATISGIVCGRGYRHLPWPDPGREAYTRRHCRAALTDATAAQALELLAAGHGRVAVARQLQVSHAAIELLDTGRTYRHLPRLAAAR